LDLVEGDQALIEAELTEVFAPHDGSAERSAQRNGHRARILTTTAGDLELRIAKLRTGSFFPSLLERRRRVDQALFAVVMEAYLHGVSTRKVDERFTPPVGPHPAGSRRRQ
jgi:putative transposase